MKYTAFCFTLCLLSNLAFSQQKLPEDIVKSIQDSLFFLKTKAEFTKFEQAHGHYIQTDHVKMHYLTWGKPAGTPVVWVHGTGSNGYELMGFADSLVKLGYYVISIDYYGHGFTPIPDKEVSIYHVADDIQALLNDLKIKKCIIGGWSRGGTVATAFYDAYPERVAGLILEDGGSAAWSAGEHKKSRSIEEFRTEQSEEFAAYEEIQKHTFESEFQACKAWAGVDALDQKSIFSSLAAIKKNSAGKWVINPGVDEFCGANTLAGYETLVYRPFASTKLFGVSNVLIYPRVIYRNLSIPMLILDPVAEKDFFIFEAENEALQKEHPDLITHKVYKDTSHALKFQRADEFMKDVTSFLARVKTFKGK